MKLISLCIFLPVVSKETFVLAVVIVVLVTCGMLWEMWQDPN